MRYLWPPIVCAAIICTGLSIALATRRGADEPAVNYGFVRWRLNGVDQPAGQRTLSFPLKRDSKAVAVYSESFALQLAKGWNLVSVPFKPLDPGIDIVFPPEVCLAVWQYNNPGGYAVPIEIRPERGYWVRAAEAVTLTICGY